MTWTLTAYVPEDVEVIGVLGLLATGASDPAVRDQAACALQASHTKETLPHFAAMLEHTDPAIRLRGVLGFLAFVYGLPAPDRSGTGNKEKPRPRTAYASSEEIARAHVPGREVEAAQFWRVWWVQHRADIMR